MKRSSPFLQSAYYLPTGTLEGKKPNLKSWAKCLFLLVGRERFERSTYGLRVRKQWHLSVLIWIHKMAGKYRK